MKHIILCFFCFTQFLCTVGRAQNLSTQIEALLSDPLFDDSDVSIAVYDLDADTMLYTHRAQKLCRPASVMKIITSTVALKRLGCDYTVDTHLYSKENVSGKHNLYIKGSIDPLFSEEDLLQMSAALPEGMEVDTLFADCTFMDSIHWGPGWSWDDTPWEFQPYISPLMLNGGCVEVCATPSSPGAPPTVECRPQSDFYTIANEAVSHGKRGEKFTILRDWLNNSNVIRLRGDCNAPKSEKMNLYPSQDFFITVMRERLAERGIRISNIATSTTPKEATLIAIKQRPICDIIHEALMESNNLCAEALSYHLGALYGKFPVSQKRGPDIMEGFLEYNTKAPERFNIADGSGLSLYTYLSAEMLVEVLKLAHTDTIARDIIIAGLPQSGISGTMKHRTKNTPAYKKIFAKTGTVKGVCTLAGYAQTPNGHTLAFVILNQGSMEPRRVRNWQDKLCNVLCENRY
ncbi:MAG: D-alanyl-D-alanine carboxypeptidase/D-alanyl-D-alanine-endopeptidase [Bacteroidaceae bacterium]|nr:D-alanyl-D-alanine carboxypeptidase/D-alanyl-D-alanine-endopeptidase [Bacteroidaceae bacterium]